jgi:hypothetical protein
LYHFDGSSWSLFSASSPVFNTTASYYRKIHFVRNQTAEGWAVDNYGDIFRYQGGQWQNNLQSSMLGIWMNANNDVWACGTAGTLMRFNGQVWSPVVLPANASSADFLSISFIDSNHGVLIGNADVASSGKMPVVLYYSNGVWNNVTITPPANITNMRLFDARMVGSGEAWFIGQGTRTDTGIEVPILTRVILAATQSLMAMQTGWGRSNAIMSLGPLSSSKEYILLEWNGNDLDGGVFVYSFDEDHFASLEILTPDMKSIRKYGINTGRGKELRLLSR